MVQVVTGLDRLITRSTHGGGGGPKPPERAADNSKRFLRSGTVSVATSSLPSVPLQYYHYCMQTAKLRQSMCNTVLYLQAGLGRTGTCIGCYVMKHFGFSAAEVIAWMRICRPGSVIGPQQHYLVHMEGTMHREGAEFRQMVRSHDR